MTRFVIISLVVNFIMVLGQESFEKRSVYQDLWGTKGQKIKSQEILPGVQVNPSNFIMDNEINPRTYILGPGDQLNLFIGGQIQQNQNLLVLPEGNVIIPDVGSIDLKEKTLLEAKSLISKKIKKIHLTDEINLSIVRLRKFRVYISGQINKPGTYFLQGTDRVSRLIQWAEGFDSWADPSRINIQRQDTSLVANLWEFFYRGKLKANPYLHSGDILHVPSIDLQNPYVKIFSNSGAENYIPIMENEEIKEFLYRVHFLNNRSNVTSIEITRNDTTKIVNFLDENRQEILLKSGDEILIPVMRGEVFVTGQVLKPGPYPYTPEYTAWDYISRAGILESSQDIHDVKVFRFQSDIVEDGVDVIVNKGDVVFLGRKIREDYKDWSAIITPLLTLILSVYIAFGK